MTVARLSGRVAGGSTGPPGFPFSLGGTCSCCSGRVRDALDALPGGDDLLRPGPGRGDFQGSAASAADEAGDGEQSGVARGLRLGPGEVADEGDEPEPGQQDAGDHRGVEPRLVQLVVM